MRRGLGKTLLTRVALVVFGLGLSLLAAEALLQVGAVVVRLTGREVPATWATGNRRMICLGDSNTYGVFVQPDEPYPQTLERLIAQSDRLPTTEVINLGFPGNNSSKILHALPRILQELRPDLVMVMVGTNDWWTEPEPDPSAGAVEPTIADVLYHHSRLYRLLYMIGRSLRSAELSVERRREADGSNASGTVRYGEQTFEWAWEKRRTHEGDWGSALRENLRAMRELTRAHGAELILLTYPAEQRAYGQANAIVREEAQASGTPLVDLAPVFRELCPEMPCPEIFYKDNHPTAAGYRIAAEQIRTWFEARGK